MISEANFVREVGIKNWFYIIGGKIKQYKFNFENKVAVFRLVFYFLRGVRGENQAFFGRQIYEIKLGWRRIFVLMRSDL